jgi:uncharacterized protein (DUF1778 family)
VHAPGHLRDTVLELIDRLDQGEAVEDELVRALRRLWNCTDVVPHDALETLANCLEDQEVAEAIRQPGLTYAQLARRVVPALQADRDDAEVVKLSIRLPEELLEILRLLAWAHGTSVNSLVVEAVQRLVDANPLPQDQDILRRGQLRNEPLR